MPLAAAFEIPVETYGPLTVDSVNCDRETPHGQCAPGGSWSLELSNAVPLKDLKRALSITPAVPLRFENWTDESTPVSYLSITAPFRAGAKYALRVAGDLRDVHGQSLGRAFATELAIDDYFPAVEIGVQGHLLDPRSVSTVPVGSLNVASYGLRTAALSAEDALLLVERRAAGSAPETASRLEADARALDQPDLGPESSQQGELAAFHVARAERARSLGDRRRIPAKREGLPRRSRRSRSCS